jgi:hypothetical protein
MALSSARPREAEGAQVKRQSDQSSRKAQGKRQSLRFSRRPPGRTALKLDFDTQSTG